MNDLLPIITNYGLAGVVIFIFYKLMTNELKDLQKAIYELRDEIKRLGDKIG